MQQYVLAPVQATWQPGHIGESDSVDVGEYARADWDRGQPLSPVRLTPIQKRIYDYIREHQRLWGDTPLYREIARECGLGNVSSVQYQIRRLTAAGLVRKPRRRVRAICLAAVPVRQI